jgi:phosphate starvation-inducible protein PhoH and related proteins
MAKRAEKRQDSLKVIKPKFADERSNYITPIKPLNQLQAHYINCINNKKLIIATGLPGTSKTFIPTSIACDKWRLGEIDRIFLTRPNISNSKSLGFFGGSLVEKMTNWLMPVLDVMYQRLGRNIVELAIKSGDIAFIPLEVIKGMSFGENTFVICDESEDATISEMKSILTRHNGCTMVLAGDIEQSALNENSGLAKIIHMIRKYPNLEDITGIVDFNRYTDIVRSAECKEWIMAFNKEDNILR